MKLSLSWVKKFTVADLPIDKLVEKIGAQLGAVDEVVNLGKRYEGIVVAKVVSCQKHPNANKLSVCKINDAKTVHGVSRDDKGLVQVVCGAPNVAEGQLVVWIPPGVTVPSTYDKDPFVIESRKIRGVMSDGMLASPKELAMGDNHEGLLIVDEDARSGDNLTKIYQLDDYIIDIENKMFTHRPDCFGILGVARELAGIQNQTFKSPTWYRQAIKIEGKNILRLDVKNDIPKLVPRFMAVAMSDVEVKPSPIWLQSYLNRVGVKPINNVVDLTNYYMLLTAQPLHAYDYDKIKTGTLGIRLSKSGENLKLLGGKDVRLDKDAILVTDGKKPVGLGGVMGGADTEVDENTKNIILECANFDMNSIRKTAMTYGLFTDAATRFTKNQSPLQNPAVLAKAVVGIKKIAGGEVASKLVDDRAALPKPNKIKTSAEFINSRLGLDLSAERMKKMLTNVEFKVELTGETLAIIAPFWRTDIEIPEDIVEEIGRLYGYNHLDLKLPMRDLTPPKLNKLLELKSRIRSILSGGGANEVLTYSFLHGSLLQKAGQDAALAYQIRNALSPDLQYYRLSLTPSLLEKVHPNIKLGYDSFALFEMGKGHNKKHSTDGGEKVPQEFNMLAFVVAANNKAVSEASGAAFFHARAYLDFLAQQLGIELQYRPIAGEENYPVVKPFDHSRSAQVWSVKNNLPLGMVGEYKDDVIGDLKLPKYCAGFEIGIDQILASLPMHSSYKPLPRFPKVEQDITLSVSADLEYAELCDFVEKEFNKARPARSLVILKPISIYQKDKTDKHKAVTFRLTVTSYERTLTAAEVNNILDTITMASKNKFGAKRI